MNKYHIDVFQEKDKLLMLEQMSILEDALVTTVKVICYVPFERLQAKNCIITKLKKNKARITK